jgi:hypothetical protein
VLRTKPARAEPSARRGVARDRGGAQLSPRTRRTVRAAFPKGRRQAGVRSQLAARHAVRFPRSRAFHAESHAHVRLRCPTEAPHAICPLQTHARQLTRPGRHTCHICNRDWARPPTAAPGLDVPVLRLHRDWAHPSHIRTGTGPMAPTSVPGERVATAANAWPRVHVARSLRRVGRGLAPQVSPTRAASCAACRPSE